MSKPRDPWWGYMKNVIRMYPNLKAEHDALHASSMVANYSGMSGSHSGANRTVENIAIKELRPLQQSWYEAVDSAVRITEMFPNGERRMQLISGLYWDGRYSKIADACTDLGYEEVQLKRFHVSFVHLVARMMGLEE